VEGYVAPTEDQLRQALLHPAGLSGTDRPLVHCHAGKSRSPPLAIGILVQARLSPSEAFDRVRGIGPALIPNRLMIRQLDDILGL
jgi:predicted protein tyrosine phosphatase